MSDVLHPFEVQELDLNKAAAIIDLRPKTLQKQIEQGLWRGVFYKAGQEWRTTLRLIAEGQKAKAQSDS